MDTAEPLSKLHEMAMPANMYPRQRHTTHTDDSSMALQPPKRLG
jgi:hypothetical protein